MNYQNPQLRQRLASEYVLGTLRYGAARRFEQLLKEDAVLQELVDEIQTQYSPLIELLPPEPVDEIVWSRIQAQLFGKTALEGARIGEKRKGFADFFIKAWATAATLALMVVFWQSSERADEVPVIVEQPAQPPVQEPQQAPRADLLAVLSSAESNNAAWLLRIDPLARQITASTLEPQEIDVDRVFELWVKLPTEASVLSVGLISADGTEILALAQEVSDRIGESEFFGVSVEPPGGSPTGQPTTTPSYVGKLLRI